MPIYEYRCKACGALYEKLQSITDSSRPPCESCGSSDTTRLISMSAFHLKGSGWYVTDYKAKNNGSSVPSEKKPGESKPSESKPSESKPSESKPSEGKPSEGKPSESKPSA